MINIDEKRKDNSDLEYNKAEEFVKDQLIKVQPTTLFPQNLNGSIEGAKNINYAELINKCVMGDLKSRTFLKERIKQLLQESNLVDFNKCDDLAQEIYINNFGLGPIDDLVYDKTINEIWVNGFDQIWIEKNGEKIRIDKKFKSNEDIERVMRQMLHYDKKEINLNCPKVESKMLNGSRLTFTIPPLSPAPYINIRKFEAFELTEDNITKDTMSEKVLETCKLLYKGRANTLVIGETGAGKTSLIKFLCKYVDENLRIGTIESSFELKLSKKYPNRNIFEYESHEELGYDLGELFKLALRSSPDVIWLGEVRSSAEAEMLLNSMRRGHQGSNGTFHTNSPDTVVEDLCSLITEDGKRRDPSMLRDRVVKAIDIVIQIHKYEDKKRRIASITEVIDTGSLENQQFGNYQLNTLWEYDLITNTFKKVNGIKNKSLLKKMRIFGLSDNELLQLADETIANELIAKKESEV